MLTEADIKDILTKGEDCEELRKRMLIEQLIYEKRSIKVFIEPIDILHFRGPTHERLLEHCFRVALEYYKDKYKENN